MRLRIALLLIGAALAYSNAMPAPFVLDDTNSVVNNTTIRQLSPLSVPLSPPGDTPVARRPVVNLTFALDYAAGGLDPRGYRAVNLLIHVLVALVLFGIVRRTPGMSTDLALGVALIWMLHPLNSEVVDYVTQRSESLMALAYLLTLYCAIRGWTGAAIAACAVGVFCKESIVTAPVAVVLYDRIFLFDSFAAALRRRGRLYAGLFASWLLLALMMSSGQRTSAGFGAGVSVITYLLNQIRLIPRYLYLAVWPHALVADYGLPQPLAFHDVLIPGLVLAAVVALTIFLLVRWPRLGFCALWVFLTLAPTSSFVPVATEVGAERRMYLPLAGLVSVAVVGGWLVLRRTPARVRIAMVAAVCVLAGAGTYLRNREYRDPVILGRTIVERWPSGRGHFFYGMELVSAGRHEEGIEEFRRSAANYPGGHYALGGELIDAGRIDEGVEHLREFIRLAPNDSAVAPAHDLIGRVLMTRNQFDAAADEFSAILARDPANTRALIFLGDARWRQGRIADAVASYERARAIDPSLGGDGTVLGRLAIGLAEAHRDDDALRAGEDAVRATPESAALQMLLGQLLAGRGRVAEAVPHFQRAVELAPNDQQARTFLAMAERQAGQPH